MGRLKYICVFIVFIGCINAKHSVDKDASYYQREFNYEMGQHYASLEAFDSTDKKNIAIAISYFRKYLGADTLRYRQLTDNEQSAFFLVAVLYFDSQNYERLYSWSKIIMRLYPKYIIMHSIGELFDSTSPYNRYKIKDLAKFAHKYAQSFRNLLFLNIGDKYLQESKILEDVFDTDQKFRKQLLNKNGEIDSVPQAINDSIGNADSSNIIIVSKIVGKYGWLGQNDVGFKASEAEFLVIQHADKTTFLKYFPIIKEAYKKGKISQSNYELYMDRRSVYLHGYQIYGTQKHYDSTSRKWITYPIKR